ncbi:MAG: glycosyltransferase family 2 protein [Nitrospinales bacterium]
MKRSGLAVDPTVELRPVLSGPPVENSIVDKVSVTIIAFNEESNIERCLESVKWADEIVVLDGHSEDRTVELCRRFTDQVFQEDWNGFGRQKNLCAARASHRWILNIDADEVVSSACAEEIRRELDKGPAHTVYRFPRKNYFGKRWVRYGGWYPDHIARFYDKTRAAFTETRVHEKLFPDTNAGVFNNPLEHYSYRDMAAYVARQNRYSTLFAQEMMERGKTAAWSDVCLRPPAAFMKSYLLRQGFREGFLGLFLAAAAGFYTFLKYAKTRPI